MIDKAKLLEWLGGSRAMEERYSDEFFEKGYETSARSHHDKHVAYSLVINQIKSGIFNLIPTDVDVKEIESALKMADAHYVDRLNANASKWLRQLLTALAETKAEVNELRTLLGAAHDDVEKAEEALEWYADQNNFPPSFAYKVDTARARQALQSIKGEA